MQKDVQLSKIPFFQKISPQNTIARFVKTSICPFNPDVSSESDFLLASVTDRAVPKEKPKARRPAYEEVAIIQ